MTDKDYQSKKEMLSMFDQTYFDKYEEDECFVNDDYLDYYNKKVRKIKMSQED